MTDREKVLKGLEYLSEWLFHQYQVVYDGDAPNCYDAYKTVNDAIDMLNAQPQWISVKDRLPDNEQYVVLWTKTGVMKYAKYLDDEPHRPWIVYDDGGPLRAWDNVVTHWMPLPEPPEEVKQE